jgi:hypothetical protein
MRRRTLLVALAGLAVVVAAGAVVVLWPREDRITQENCDRIHEGMTLTEVEAILGPPGDYRNGPTDPEPQPFWAGWSVGPDPDYPPLIWQGDRGVIWVFRKGHGDPSIVGDEPDDPDNVSGTRFLEVQRVPQDPLANLLWRLKRRWHRWFPE